ncbi:response regulator transcription factor [Lacrimispora sp. 210928-DFI.3.58]|uniref:response regulator transcription factor n=1 Tax=Lacrimispora sp. 210928-DFI.3.58 TaxID=2883214 RepID=UPI001D087C2B|nr:response regulator [Lacrimispora sp. 210928-DFI.3.58]MCB7317483.1 response regulator [Lacrimispora sp. 210928-DFI.3.58]
MYNVLIVDDESIVRMMLHSMIDWEGQELNLVACAANGREALEWMDKCRIDILITDIQMPVVDGLALISHVKERRLQPEILVLSAYNDFPYVRQAFKMGIYDYCLKREISEELLKKHLKAMKDRLRECGRAGDGERLKEEDKKQLLAGLLRGQIEPSEAGLPETYYVAFFSIQEYQRIVKSFGSDFQKTFFPGLLNLADQLPQIARHGLLVPANDTGLVMVYEEKEGEEGFLAVLRLCTRLLRSWKNYMNVDMTGAVSRLAHGAEEFEMRLGEANMNLTMKYVMKSRSLFSEEEYIHFPLEDAWAKEGEYKKLIQALKSGDGMGYEEEKSRLLAVMQRADEEEAKRQALYLAYHIAAALVHQLEDSDYIYTTDLFQEISGIASSKEVCIWTVNFLNDMKRYLQSHYQFHFPDEIQVALDYINDHYYKQDLTLYEVASKAGFSEKYFSTLFNKKVGTSFSSYLKNLRIHHAKLLLRGSHRKLREISEAVGYNSVEYFVRVFSAETGMSPSVFRKKYQS